MKKIKQSGNNRRELRIFGCIMGALLLVWAIVLHFMINRPIGKYDVSIAALIVGTAFFFPGLLYWPHQLWLSIGRSLARLNIKIVLGTAYYGFVTPMALIMRLFGYDPLMLKYDRLTPSYRRGMTARKSDHFRYPY